MPEALESVPAPTPKYSTRLLVWFSGKKRKIERIAQRSGCDALS